MNDFPWRPGWTLAYVEKETILCALRYLGNNKTKTAAALEISIRCLHDKLAKYNGTSSEAGVHVESDEKVPEKQDVPVREREKVQKVSPRKIAGSGANG